jgi:hypothetical protein
MVLLDLALVLLDLSSQKTILLYDVAHLVLTLLQFCSEPLDEWVVIVDCGGLDGIRSG